MNRDISRSRVPRRQKRNSRIQIAIPRHANPGCRQKMRRPERRQIRSLGRRVIENRPFLARDKQIPRFRNYRRNQNIPFREQSHPPGRRRHRRAIRHRQRPALGPNRDRLIPRRHHRAPHNKLHASAREKIDRPVFRPNIPRNRQIAPHSLRANLNETARQNRVPAPRPGNQIHRSVRDNPHIAAILRHHRQHPVRPRHLAPIRRNGKPVDPKRRHRNIPILPHKNPATAAVPAGHRRQQRHARHQWRRLRSRRTVRLQTKPRRRNVHRRSRRRQNRPSFRLHRNIRSGDFAEINIGQSGNPHRRIRGHRPCVARHRHASALGPNKNRPRPRRRH